MVTRIGSSTNTGSCDVASRVLMTCPLEIQTANTIGRLVAAQMITRDCPNLASDAFWTHRLPLRIREILYGSPLGGSEQNALLSSTHLHNELMRHCLLRWLISPVFSSEHI